MFLIEILSLTILLIGGILSGRSAIVNTLIYHSETKDRVNFLQKLLIIDLILVASTFVMSVSLNFMELYTSLLTVLITKYVYLSLIDFKKTFTVNN